MLNQPLCPIANNSTQDHTRWNGRTRTAGGIEEQGLRPGLQVKKCENVIDSLKKNHLVSCFQLHLGQGKKIKH